MTESHILVGTLWLLVMVMVIHLHTRLQEQFTLVEPVLGIRQPGFVSVGKSWGRSPQLCSEIYGLNLAPRSRNDRFGSKVTPKSRQASLEMGQTEA